MMLVFFSWTPWTSHGVTGGNDPRKQSRHGVTSNILITLLQSFKAEEYCLLNNI
ncbi:hypothetical protein [Rickettsia bellii]|uniref:Uncharacterized protein n=1 Tax=Rickettsia bellii str. RML An4 TaxID=1359193 RepID=A0A0F3QE77_RICBE|nr:hypothetical protein [Rickettsia bellii]KJV90471.1 hypothetical protein RBEAN4_1475 [Rickettsia bellii str. RML An4]